MRHEVLGAIHQEAKAQTWRLITAMTALIGAMAGLMVAFAQA